MQQKQLITTNIYLFLIAIYFLAASTQLINILINLTTGYNEGTFFEFINAPTDRTIIYILGFTTLLIIATKHRRTVPLLVLCAYFLGSYFTYNPLADMLTVLFSLIVLVWFLTSPKPFPMMQRKKAASLVVLYMICILVVIESLGLFCWFVFPFAPELSQQGICRYLVQLETKTFILTGSLAPILTVLALFSWITKPIYPKLNILKRINSLFTESTNTKQIHIKKHFFLLMLACSLILSAIVMFYPFSPNLNPNNNPVGVDEKRYEEWLTTSANNSFFGAASTFFFEHPDRPLSLVFAYIIKGVTGLPASTVIQFFPLILAPALVFSVYFFVHKISTNYASLLAAFLAVSSFHICVGLYGFFLSNWMALIELYLFMGFYFGTLQNKSHYRIAATLLLSISLLFTHSWTWGMTIGILAIYLLLIAVYHRKNLATNKYEIEFLIILIATNVSVCIIRNLVLGFAATNFETVAFAQKTVTLTALSSFGADLFYTFFNTHYGLFVNPMALLLAAIGSFVTVFNGKTVSRYLTAWLIGSSIFFVLGAGWIIKSRILLNIPLPVFEVIGLVAITRMINKIFDPEKSSTIKNLTIAFVVLAGLNYAFRCAFEISQLA